MPAIACGVLAAVGPDRKLRGMMKGNARVLAVLLLAALAASVWLAIGGDPASGPPASAVPRTVGFGPDAGLPGGDLDDIARRIGAAVLSADPAPPAVTDSGPGSRLLFLSVSDGESPARVVPGAGADLAAALDDAWPRLMERASPRRTWVRVDLVEEVRPPEDLNLLSPTLRDPSLLGVAFERETAVALLPEELIANRLVNRAGVLDPAALSVYLKIKGVPQDAVRRLSRSKRERILRFSTRSWFLSDETFEPLYRDHRIIRDVQAAQLRKVALDAANYLEGIVDGEGRYVYRYLPDTDQKTAGYNILRHAGTTFSLLQAYEAFDEPAMLDAARRALGYLVDSARGCPGYSLLSRCIEERGEIKLGGNGLAILALSKYMVLTDDRDHLELARALARWIIEVQGPDGEFTVHKMNYPRGRVSSFVSAYYPGEALFGLLRLYEIDRDQRFLDAAEAGARWLINVRDAGKGADELPADHWLLYALAELHARRPEPLFLEHARRITEGILASQRRDEGPADWSGSFYDPPRSTPTSTRMEGLCAAHGLAVAGDRPEWAGELLPGMKRGNAFILRNRYEPPAAMYYRRPPLILGAIRGGFHDPDIRIDYVQHAVSAMLCTAAALEHAGARRAGAADK